MRITIKEIFESDNWIIKKILPGRNKVRVDARRRFPIPDKENFFSEWVSCGYANSLAKSNYGKNINSMSSYSL